LTAIGRHHRRRSATRRPNQGESARSRQGQSTTRANNATPNQLLTENRGSHRGVQNSRSTYARPLRNLRGCGLARTLGRRRAGRSRCRQLDRELGDVPASKAVVRVGADRWLLMGESTRGANLLEVVVAPSARIQVYVQMHHDASGEPCAPRSLASRDEAIVSACRIRALLVVVLSGTAHGRCGHSRSTREAAPFEAPVTAFLLPDDRAMVWRAATLRARGLVLRVCAAAGRPYRWRTAPSSTRAACPRRGICRGAMSGW
jgi:hypothetical protein